MLVKKDFCVDKKDFKQAMKWNRRAPVTQVVPESGSLAPPPKKDISRREKARVWFPRPVGCAAGIKSDDASEKNDLPEGAYGALAIYGEKHVVVRRPTERVGQPESMSAPEVPLVDTMTEDNPPHDVDYTVLSDDEALLRLCMVGDGASEDGMANRDDPFPGMLASVETGIVGILAEKPTFDEMPLPASDGDNEEDEDGGNETDFSTLSDEELVEIAGFDLSLLKEEETTKSVSGLMANLSEDELAEIAGFDPALLVDEEAAQDETVADATDGMVVATVSGFAAIVEETEEEARHEVLVKSMPDTEVFSAEEEALLVERVDQEEILSGVEASGEVVSLEGDVVGAGAEPDAVFDAGIAEDILAEVMLEAEDAPELAVPMSVKEEGVASEEVAQLKGDAFYAGGKDAEEAAVSVVMPDPETALADGIMLAQGDTPPDFEVPLVPVLDEITAGPEVTIPEEQVFREKMETHQRNKMAFAEYKVAAAYARDDTKESRREMVKWYTRAAENGHAVSQFNLANIYYAGRGVDQDYSVAADWYELAAAQGVARAQDNLGLIYFHGRGRLVDPEIAVYWFRQAAIQGYVPAQYKLAMHLEGGVGVEPDPDEALNWYKKAAAQGDVKAQKEVARLMGNDEM